MSCSTYITSLAQNIWNDLGQPTDMTVAYIQSKLTSNAFLGKINALTTNCHEIVDGDIVPVLDINEQAIAALQYEADYYISKFNTLANGTDIAFITIADGDSRITKASIVDLMRVYRDMQKQLNAQLNALAYNYRQADAFARSVDYLSVDNSWNGIGWWMGNSYPPGN